MLRDIRETLYLELQNPESQREFILAYAEEEGADGVLKALTRIAEAKRYAASPRESPTAKRRIANPRPSFRAVRSRLNAVGLDFAVTGLRSDK